MTHKMILAKELSRSIADMFGAELDSIYVAYRDGSVSLYLVEDPEFSQSKEVNTGTIDGKGQVTPVIDFGRTPPPPHQITSMNTVTHILFRGSCCKLTVVNGQLVWRWVRC